MALNGETLGSLSIDAKVRPLQHTTGCMHCRARRRWSLGSTSSRLVENHTLCDGHDGAAGQGGRAQNAAGCRAGSCNPPPLTPSHPTETARITRGRHIHQVLIHPFTHQRSRCSPYTTHYGVMRLSSGGGAELVGIEFHAHRPFWCARCAATLRSTTRTTTRWIWPCRETLPTVQDSLEKSGWKLIHGDVMRPPIYAHWCQSALCSMTHACKAGRGVRHRHSAAAHDCADHWIRHARHAVARCSDSVMCCCHNSGSEPRGADDDGDCELHADGCGGWLLRRATVPVRIASSHHHSCVIVS